MEQLSQITIDTLVDSNFVFLFFPPPFSHVFPTFQNTNWGQNGVKLFWFESPVSVRRGKTA